MYIVYMLHYLNALFLASFLRAGIYIRDEHAIQYNSGLIIES